MKLTHFSLGSGPSARSIFAYVYPKSSLIWLMCPVIGLVPRVEYEARIFELSFSFLSAFFFLSANMIAACISASVKLG